MATTGRPGADSDIIRRQLKLGAGYKQVTVRQVPKNGKATSRTRRVALDLR
jgi:hypothetical protein